MTGSADNNPPLSHNTMEKNYEERIQRAVDYFMQGFGCSQSVLLAFADLYGLDHDTAKRIASGFGGGVGRMRMMCGAVSGMVMLAGLDKGQTEGSDRNGKAECYDIVQNLVKSFKERNGSVICAELLAMGGCRPSHSPVPDERNAEYYRKRPCAWKVESAARVFAEYLDRTRSVSCPTP